MSKSDTTAEILVLFYSPGGTTAEMANIIARGVEEALHPLLGACPGAVERHLDASAGVHLLAALAITWSQSMPQPPQCARV